MRPRILITANLTATRGGDRVRQAYLDAVKGGGGEPIVVPISAAAVSVGDMLGETDGLLVTGGADLAPALWGEARHKETRVMDPRRQEMDLALIAAADASGLPVLGICLGCQELAVHRRQSGQTPIIQHLPDAKGGGIDHGRAGQPRAVHDVVVERESLLAGIVGAGRLEVNSTHHQAVREPGRGMRVVARSGDGVIEAIEDPTPGRFFLGVQWHPEDLIGERPHLALFEALCGAAARHK